MRLFSRVLAVLLAAFLLLSSGGTVHAQDTKAAEHGGLAEYIHRAPAQPTEVWLHAAGGRIYDNWWDALDRKKPEGTHPAYPRNGQRTGANSWRCVECHGWDYNGKDGLYGSGERFTGIKAFAGPPGEARNASWLCCDPRHTITASG